jgi:GNAT superfamily N-acetyltransferase
MQPRAQAVSVARNPMPTLIERRRSVGFFEHDDRSWACFLVTSPDRRGRWTGYFSFRPGDSEHLADEVRTADIFVEGSEAEVHEKARGLGRPLLKNLLASALHTARRGEDDPQGLRKRFRDYLVKNAKELGDWNLEVGIGDEMDRLRTLYASYRLDQVAHFICLVDAGAFQEAVDLILDGATIDFRASDRIQFAMMVVEHIERALPLPPFAIWARDFIEHPDAYRLYAHTLHREGRLP